MMLYLDEDSTTALLIRHLRTNSHDVTTPAFVGLLQKKDPEQFMYAIRTQRTLFTHNHEDFDLLHRLVMLVRGHHPGVLVVRRDNDPTRDMTAKGIARALQNLLAANVPIANELHVLNHWR